MADRSALFRTEVAAARAQRLQGTVSIVLPLSWQIIGGLLITSVAVAVAFLASATYARVETVPGIVTLDRGVAALIPSRPGVVTAVAVREGQRVEKGQSLAAISSEDSMAGGGTAPELVRRALGEQDSRLEAQGGMMADAARADAARLSEQVRGAQAELAGLDAQIGDQQRLVDAAASEYAEVRSVADKGFISRRDMESREATIISRRQQLAQLRQMRSAKLAEMNEARRAIVQSGATAMAQVAATETQRATLRERLAATEESAGYVMRAPFAGTVTALTARVGQRVAADGPLALVVPDGARAMAELYVPTSSAGFVGAGQVVRLAIDAFPYQRFGTVETTIDSVSRAATSHQVGTAMVPVYLVSGRIPRPSVQAFGREQPVLPGMTLTARIMTERRTLLEWLFEPVLAVRNR